MGQQQLLLVILVTIIVGIATVVAINTFGTAADSANLDAVRQDISQIAAAAQGYYLKPEMLGGGSRAFTGITFNDIAFAANGIDEDGTTAQNENGFYVLSVTDAQTLTVTAHPASDDAYVPGTVDEDGVLTVGTDAGETIVGTVEPNNLEIN
jgi:type II secretory pathway pseudopilin PulG